MNLRIHFAGMIVLLLPLAGAFSQAPDNDTCLFPFPLQLNGPQLVGDTGLAEDDQSSSCAVGFGGKDVVFTFTLAATADAVLRTSGSDFDTVLSIWSDCDGESLIGERACNDDFQGITSRLDLVQLGPGTYYVLLDGFDGLQSGQYRIQLSSPISPLNDTCDDAEFVNVGNRIDGSTLGAANDAEILGRLSAGPDVFYRFQSTASAIRVDTLGSDLDTVIQIREGSCSGSVVGVNDNFGGTAQSQVDLGSLPIGADYFVQVDAGPGKAGTFQLRLSEIQPAPANDNCLSVTEAIQVPSVQSGTTLFAANDSSDSSGQGDGPDVVFRIDVEQGASLELDTQGTGFDTLLYVRQGSCEGPQVGSNDDALGRKTSHLSFTLLDAGTYFVFLDGKSLADRGPYSLAVSSGVTPSNDTCQTAQVLTFPTVVGGSTLFAEDDTQSMTPGCESNDHDVVFAFSLASPTRMRIDTVGSGFDTVVYLRTGDCTGETEIACSDNFPGLGLLSRIDQYETAPLAAGDYRVYVDGNDEAGDFVLNLLTLDGDPTPDIDRNGKVEAADLISLVEQWRAGMIDPNQSADLDSNGSVDFEDLGTFLPSWQSMAP